MSIGLESQRSAKEKKGEKMIRVEKGAFQASGPVNELIADFGVLCQGTYSYILEDLPVEARCPLMLTVLIKAVTEAITGDDEDDDEEHGEEMDALTALIKEALRKEFDDE